MRRQTLLQDTALQQAGHETSGYPVWLGLYAANFGIAKSTMVRTLSGRWLRFG
jgi:hypothetical protein